LKRCLQGHQYTGRCEQCRKAYTSRAYRAMPRPVMACPECGVVAKMTVDHIVPIAQGGTNEPGNLRWMCLPCNVKKGAA